ncbi:glycosyltransferase [Sphingomonas montanisoli]|uniref:Glycosyltransferase n=1 Tax=Sphingomonas montanisoli TaxID=2606412 RepID=A0A5D9C263_9SPHN|nr:glycosyltransferase [Sphingomonas montanisoli]TZG25854.1 glycosyltransferase [Sphingomonas montanisoli]
MTAEPTNSSTANAAVPIATRYPIFLSVVVVDRDQADTQREFLTQMVGTLGALVEDFEIILVDNGSAPEARAAYDALARVEGVPNLQVYHLLRRVDAETAYWAGIENSIGDYVLAFDPYNDELTCLPKAIELCLAGTDLVLIENQERERAKGIEALAGRAFRGLYRSIYGVGLTERAAQHRLMSKKVISFLLQLPRPAIWYRVLPARAGFATVTLTYRAPRSKSKIDHNFTTRARRATNLLFSSTLAPLRFVSMLALLGSVANILYSIYVVIIAFSMNSVARGWTTLSLQQSGMFFLLSIVFFVLAEYMVRMVQWSMGEPPYFIVGEAVSSTLTRHQKLNVEAPRADDQ